MSAGNCEQLNVVVPSLGWSEVQVSVWFAEPGDRVYEGDRLLELVAGGATFDVAAPATGRLTERKAFARDTVQPGQVVGVVVADPE